tara:strand:- start:1563 stop:1964 length:402 start_codon:yes stop_codon:yes gene_type:complete
MNYSFDKIHFNMDDRAERYLNVFSNIEGQINISYVKSTNHIVAWHKHEKQTDYWVCVKGSFKVGLSQDEKTDFIYLTEKEPRVLKIPPGIYHGYKALEPESIMLYYLSDKYDPEDEHRAKVGDFGESWNRENK